MPKDWVSVLPAALYSSFIEETQMQLGYWGGGINVQEGVACGSSAHLYLACPSLVYGCELLTN